MVSWFAGDWTAGRLPDCQAWDKSVAAEPMPQPSALPPFAAIVVAGGKGLRAGQSIPKQFAPYQGKPLVRHSVEALLDAGAAPVCVVVPKEHEQEARGALNGCDVTYAHGGNTRQQSVANGLATLAIAAPQAVLVHDAARPDLPREVIARLLTALDDAPGAIPVLPVVDSIAQAENAMMAGPVERDTLRRVQTPQAFRFAELQAAFGQWSGTMDASDDAQVMHAAGFEIALVDGDERLKKITFAQDFEGAHGEPPMRMGQGFDVHRLATGEELWLGGIRIDHAKGLVGHSDADVALHAIVDALLGAIAQGDIGTHFPPSEARWKGAPSSAFLEHARDLVAAAGYAIGNIDLTIMCEAPKIGPHRAAMAERIAALLSVDPSRISVKATTTERLGFTGRGEGIAAQAIATVWRAD